VAIGCARSASESFSAAARLLVCGGSSKGTRQEKLYPGTASRLHLHLQSLIPDQEETYAQEVGDFLRIPVKFVQWIRRSSSSAGRPEVNAPEPVEDPFLAGFSTLTATFPQAAGSVVREAVMSCKLPDVPMCRFAHRGEWQQLLTDVANYLWVRPFRGGASAPSVALVRRDPDQPVYPALAGSGIHKPGTSGSTMEGTEQQPNSWPSILSTQGDSHPCITVMDAPV